jgi:hypothetical protein
MHGSNEDNSMILDRRADERVRCCGERMVWKREQSRRNRKGWLNDVSVRGVSFLIDQRRQPCAGEMVEVRTDRHSDPLSFTVKRVTPEGEDLALVACERALVEALAMNKAA